MSKGWSTKEADGRRGKFHSVRIPEALFRHLQQIAKIERQSVSKVAMLMIESGLNAEFDTERIGKEMQRIIDHYDLRSELHTNDADLAATLVAIAREALTLDDTDRIRKEMEMEEEELCARDLLTDKSSH